MRLVEDCFGTGHFVENMDDCYFVENIAAVDRCFVDKQVFVGAIVADLNNCVKH